MVKKGKIRVSSDAPSPPKDADFAIYISFKKGEGNPQRVFQAADAMIRGMQKLDRTLCDTVDGNIKPLLVLEDIEVGSLKIWLKNVLESTDDQALKSMEWKRIVGDYLVKAKYAYISWVNNAEKRDTVVDLTKRLQSIAAETNVKYLPDYKPPSIQDLLESTKDIEKAKSFLIEGDGISYISEENGKVDFDLEVPLTAETLSDLITKETVRFPPAPMILAVKKPDYLGNTKWDLRHGKKAISAKIEDATWLTAFQNREIDVRPGDALRCNVIIEHSYGFDNELVAESYLVSQVTEVLENQFRSSEKDLFDRGL